MKLAMIILAAGLSRRMGVLKPVLPVGGMPAVTRLARLARSCGIDDIYAVTGYCGELVENALSSVYPPVKTVYNAGYESGMFSSIIAGVKALAHGYDGVFLQPSDCAAVSEDTLKMSIDAFGESDGNTLIRPKIGDKRGHPPLIPAALIVKLLSYNGTDGMRGFLNTCPFTIVETDDAGIVLDMDTPEAYADLLKYLNLPVYPSRSECFELFKKYETPEQIIDHGKHVASAALKIAEFMQSGGAEHIDTALLESACLLHDIAREQKDHAREGKNLLLREGYPEAAVIVGEHMDPPDRPFERVGESELLCLADKLCRRGKIVPLADTARALEIKFRGDTEALVPARKRIRYTMQVADYITARYGDFFDILTQSL